ncbi:recombination and repair protein [Enterobacter cloacae]|uniref:Recombination and repair protein n=1 Tax=Enterobacter cloacae TaxID=550 RepID=A0A377LUG6_ENTCL|nr:recombination and repair protein [Enterobacter cloacae]
MVRMGANRADLCARFSLKDTPAACAGSKKTSLKMDVSVYFAALSAATVGHVVLSTARRYRFLNFASWVSCLFRYMVSTRISSWLSRSSKNRYSMAMQVSMHLLS